MNFDNISSNDDDLFQDSSSQQEDLSFSDEEFNVQRLLKSLDISEENLDSIILRARIVTTLIDSANSFVYETNSLTRSIFTTLNTLTDNSFQYSLYAETLEETIFRRIIIQRFLLSFSEDVDEQMFSAISKITKLDLDSRFLKTYFTSMSNIMEFSIHNNISIYNKLCEEINRAPINFDIDDNFDLIQAYFKPHSYINNVFRNIRDSLGFGYKFESD